MYTSDLTPFRHVATSSYFLDYNDIVSGKIGGLSVAKLWGRKPPSPQARVHGVHHPSISTPIKLLVGSLLPQ